jgi:hypothetical protein
MSRSELMEMNIVPTELGTHPAEAENLVTPANEGIADSISELPTNPHANAQVTPIGGGGTGHNLR